MSFFARAKKAKENKKGFTLVELIVVMVILVILAAILVPALTKWIDKAREKQIVVDARTAYLAAQTLGSEAYGTGASGAEEIRGAVTDEAILDLAELKDKGTIATLTYDDTGKVIAFAFTENGVTVQLNGIETGTPSWSTVSE